MNDHKVNGEVKNLKEALDACLERWEKTLDDNPEAKIESRFEGQLHSLRGWSTEAAAEYEWALEFVEVSDGTP
jgi:hypothetical protein